MFNLRAQRCWIVKGGVFYEPIDQCSFVIRERSIQRFQSCFTHLREAELALLGRCGLELFAPAVFEEVGEVEAVVELGPPNGAPVVLNTQVGGLFRAGSI